LQHIANGDVTSASVMTVEIDSQPVHFKDLAHDRELNPQGLPLLKGMKNTIMLSLYLHELLPLSSSGDPVPAKQWDSLLPGTPVSVLVKAFTFANDSISMFSCINFTIIKPTPVIVFKRWW
jgi:hypothetical protein